MRRIAAAVTSDLCAGVAAVLLHISDRLTDYVRQDRIT